jgi:hypothetical protein
MDFKQYCFGPHVRVCVYNIGQENLDFHSHKYVSDITYCASGPLVLELPEQDRIIRFGKGQIVQVPNETAHRVRQCVTAIGTSRYVLVQLGDFSIDFHSDLPMRSTAEDFLLRDGLIKCYVDPAHDCLNEVMDEFAVHRPDNLSESEYADLIDGLSAIRRSAYLQKPCKSVILEQLSPFGKHKLASQETLP